MPTPLRFELSKSQRGASGACRRCLLRSTACSTERTRHDSKPSCGAGPEGRHSQRIECVFSCSERHGGLVYCATGCVRLRLRLVGSGVGSVGTAGVAVVADVAPDERLSADVCGDDDGASVCSRTAWSKGSVPWFGSSTWNEVSSFVRRLNDMHSVPTGTLWVMSSRSVNPTFTLPSHSSASATSHRCSQRPANSPMNFSAITEIVAALTPLRSL